MSVDWKARAERAESALEKARVMLSNVVGASSEGEGKQFARWGLADSDIARPAPEDASESDYIAVCRQLDQARAELARALVRVERMEKALRAVHADYAQDATEDPIGHQVRLPLVSIHISAISGVISALAPEATEEEKP